MPVRKTIRKTARRSVRKAVEVEESPEMQAQKIHHLHTVMDFKVALALAFVAVSSMFITVYAKSPTGGVTASVTPVATTTGKLIVTAKVDSETVSHIVTPTGATTSAGIVLGKWNVVAENEPVALRKITLSAINADYTVRTGASEFDQLSLFTNSDVLLGSTAMVSGAAQFNTSGLVIEPGKPQTLILKSKVTGSGIMKENSMIRFGVNLQMANTWQAAGVNSGFDLGFTDIKFGSPTYAIGALTPLNLYHNSAPLIYSSFNSWSSGLKTPTENSKIFALNVLTRGDRDLRLGKIMINVSAIGMANGGFASTTGVVTDFKLYENTGDDSLGTLIGSASSCLVSPKVGGPQLGTVVLPGVGTCSIGNIFVTFDQKNDVNGAMDMLTVPAQSKRAFILTANTKKIRVGKTSGTVSLVGKVLGSTGVFPSSNPKTAFWAGGGLSYYYTPVAGSENAVAYNQSDFYPVVGETMNF